MASSSANVIIFGGCGFIGRNLVQFLIDNDLVNYIRIVDKVPPELAWLNAEHQKVLNDCRVEFRSANLISQESAEKCFEGIEFDYAVNCACETKLGQSEQVYEKGVHQLSVSCAKASALHNVKRFVEVSTAWVYGGGKKERSETDKCDPFSAIAKFKLEAENSLADITGLNYVVLRTGLVYGKGDRSAIGGRLVIASLYKYLNEKMLLLGNSELPLNTVHVIDVSRAIWHLLTVPNINGQTFNLADDGRTTLGQLSKVLAELYGIEYGFVGKTVSSLAKIDITSIVEDANEKHLGPWAEICAKDGISNTPLSPYIYQELLSDKPVNISSEKIRSTGFHLQVPRISVQLMREIIDDFVEMKMFPKSLLPS